MILEEIGQLKGYALLDTGNGMRLERFGEYVLARPDPQVLWQRTLSEEEWQKADAIFEKSEEDRGNWKINNPKMAEKWIMDFEVGTVPTKQKISFYAKLNPFKHTGVFPEQSANWQFMAEKIIAAQKLASFADGNRKLKFLNLFGYTGIASVLAAQLGCEVTHVDASKPSLTVAKENMLASNLPEDAIRWILDDATKFVKREVKRGNKYDGIILDPPAFGRGAKGEVWKFSEDLPILLKELEQICSDDFQFLVINAYAVSVSSLMLNNLLQDLAKNIPNNKKNIDYGELVLKQENQSNRMLSTGIFARLY